MLKKLTLLALAVSALAAFGASNASASWYDKGVALGAGQNPTIHLTGPIGFTSSAGHVHCTNATANIQATGGSTDGHVTAFAPISNPTESCHLSGGIVLLCGGTTKLETVILVGTPTATLTKVPDTVDITNVKLTQSCANGFGFELSSETNPLVISNITTPSAIVSGTIAGTLKSTLSSGTVAVHGDMTVTPSEQGTYGITEK